MSVIIGAFPPSFLATFASFAVKTSGFGSQLPIFGSFGDFGNLLGTLPLPYPSQIGVGFREVIPNHPRLA